MTETLTMRPNLFAELDIDELFAIEGGGVGGTILVIGLTILGGVAGALGGAVAGTAVGLPVVGAVAGGIGGAIAGAAAGVAIASYFGW